VSRKQGICSAYLVTRNLGRRLVVAIVQTALITHELEEDIIHDKPEQRSVSTVAKFRAEGSDPHRAALTRT
jgi:hypothetical protein